MTKTFGKYAEYYDLLYQDKDYEGEAEFVDGQVKGFAPGAQSILDLGCGAGNHDLLLCEKGYIVTGVDCSQVNIDKAYAKQLNQKAGPSNLDFIKDDIRAVRLNKKYDVVLSLFHVISYQTSDDDLKSAFTTAKAHLKKGGLFVFDCWYGPAVLSDRPALRVKNAENDNIIVVRIAEPELFPNENLVHVNYRALIIDKKTRKVSDLKETHCMRYLFKPEIDHMLHDTGFKLLHWGEWISNAVPGSDTWSVFFIASA
jgi:SAM-dependent methyltransferase